MSDKMVKMSDVLDKLENFAYELDEIKPHGTWISCKDRLPEDTTCVLVTDGESIEITFFDGEEWEMYDGNDEHICIYGGVTHWMPLPIPPLHEAEAEEERARTAGYDGSF